MKFVTKYCVPEDYTEDMTKSDKLGQDKFETFNDEIFVTNKTGLYEKVKTSIEKFSSISKKIRSTTKDKMLIHL